MFHSLLNSAITQLIKYVNTYPTIYPSLERPSDLVFYFMSTYNISYVSEARTVDSLKFV